MFRNRSVDAHNFAMIPRADIPRSSFRMEKSYKSTFDSGYLIPFYLEEILPGDAFAVSSAAFARMATPLYPIMDNLHLDTFFFFVPNRLIWSNWEKMQGEQANPGDSISYIVPQQVSPASGYAANSLQDYFGLPVSGTPAILAAISHNALPLRAYNLIWNEWFRDENLQNSVVVDMGDGPDNVANYVLKRRGKRHDYFTSCLPWPQKGGVSVSLPLGTSAPVLGLGVTGANVAAASTYYQANGASIPSGTYGWTGTFIKDQVNSSGTASVSSHYPNVYADLSLATAATINQLRQAFQTQRLLERDARGGTRYAEIVRSHFGVISPDARLQRPEYLGGTSAAVDVRSVAQTSASGVTGGNTPLAQLGAIAQVVAKSGFSQSFTEHGFVVGLLSVRADLTYQQGLHRLWSRSTRYDYYMPVFAMLGEQAVLNKELFINGSASDNLVFGYQERWAEYRHAPSQVTGLFRSQVTGTLDGWHLAQKFSALPTLNASFIEDSPPMSRVLAVSSQVGKEFLLDVFFDIRAARPLPLYSVPGMIDRF